MGYSGAVGRISGNRTLLDRASAGRCKFGPPICRYGRGRLLPRYRHSLYPGAIRPPQCCRELPRVYLVLNGELHSHCSSRQAIAPDSYESALTLLSVLARHFGLTRNPGGWFSIMSEALDVLTAEDVADGSATQDHHELLQGPLGDSALRSQVANMLRSNREHSWGGRVVSAYCDRLSTILSVSRGRGPSHYVQRAAIQMAAGSRLLTLVPGEVLFGKENPSKFRLISITACVWELASASDQVSRDLCTAALLRLDRYFTIRSEVALDHDHLRALLESDAVAAELRLELVSVCSSPNADLSGSVGITNGRATRRGSRKVDRCAPRSFTDVRRIARAIRSRISTAGSSSH